MKRVALIGGGFKPPTKGHYNMIKRADNDSLIDKVIVFIGSKARDHITANNSKEILEMYGFSNKVTFIISETSPIGDVYRYIKSNQDQKISWVLGYRDEEDKKDMGKRIKYLKDYYNDVNIIKVKGSTNMRGTLMRASIISNNKKQFEKFVPSHVNKSKVWGLLAVPTYL